MKLQESQIIEILKNPKNSGEVEVGRFYESYLRIFTEPKFKEDLEKEEAWKHFLKCLDSRITSSKAYRICEFIQYPLSVCNIPNSLMSDLYRVFNAGNSFFSIDSVKKNGGEKLQKTLAEVNINTWIEKHGKEVLKNKPNTIVVVDKNDEGEPFLFDVGMDRVIDFEFVLGSYVQLKYIVFKHSFKKNEAGEDEERIGYYDNYVYSVFVKDGSNYILEKTVEHNLGYCPARMFLEERLNNNRELNRKSPLSASLSKLEEWQLFETFKFYTDHYNPFPVTEMVREKCSVDGCVKGVVYREDVYYERDEKKTRTVATECKACKNKNQIGVGAKILLDPQAEKDEPSASGKFRMISNDVSNLVYLKDKLNEIEEYIKNKVVGEDRAVTKEAVNEKQVKGSFESKTNVLLSIKTNLDSLFNWIAKTVCKLAIGDKPVTINANFGTEWYLVSEAEMQKKYKEAKEGGLPREEVDMIYMQYVETKYRGNPQKINRLRILNKINPCPHSTQKERIDLYTAGLISKEDLIICEKIVYFANKFEQENGVLSEFGEKLTELQQYQNIYNIFKNYAGEYIKENQSEQGQRGDD